MILKELLFKQPSIAKHYGGFNFGTDIFGEDELTPHYEMKKSFELFETRPLINSGIKQLVRFIVGNGVHAMSDDKKSKEFLQKWLDLRMNIIPEFENAITQALISGNVYIEDLWLKTEKSRIFDGFDVFPDSSNIYINLYDENNRDKYFLIEVPRTVYKFMGQTSSMYFINYFYQDRVFKKSIWGVAFPKSKFYHLKLGFSRNSVYGRSYVSSVINDATAMQEILKNIAIISRYRALNNKIIMPGDEQEDIIEDDIENIKARFEELKDGSHVFVNKKLKIESMSNSNEYDTMINEIEFLRKEISSGLVPNFITPFNSEVNRATAQEAKIPFALEIEYLQKIFENYFSMIIVDSLRKTYSWLAKDLRIRFGNIDMESKDQKMQYYNQLYAGGIITLNEYRVSAGFEPVPGGDKYSFQISVPEDTMSHIPK